MVIKCVGFSQLSDEYCIQKVGKVKYMKIISMTAEHYAGWRMAWLEVLMKATQTLKKFQQNCQSTILDERSLMEFIDTGFSIDETRNEKFMGSLWS